MASRNELAAEYLAACGGSVLRLWKGAALGEPATVSHTSGVHSVAWNRNNKVVASGCEDGVIQLSYSSGNLMSVLRGPGGAPLGSLGSLDWSMGSKFLAAGSNDGGVYVWDLKVSKGCSTLARQAAPVTSVRYHPDDRFLAVASAGGAVTLYDFHGSQLASLAAAGSGGGAKRSLQAAAGEHALAAGSDDGSVLVWDWSAKQLKEQYQGQHAGAVSAVSFIPLKPGMLYSAGADGWLVLQDRRAGPSYANRVDVGVPLSSLSVREDYASVAVGTAEGTVLLYDPRHLASPLHRLTCAAGSPVADLHWQHCYSSLGVRMRTTAAKSKVQPSSHQGTGGAAAAGAAVATAAASVGAEARIGGVAAAAATASAIPQPAAASRIPQAAATSLAGAGNPTYSALRRHSGIGTGGPHQAAAVAAKVSPRQPSSRLGTSMHLPPPSPMAQLNPLYDPQSRAAQETLEALSQSQAADHGVARTPLQPVGATAFGGSGAKLNITPLSGMALPGPSAAPTPSHITPAPQRPAPLRLPEQEPAGEAAAAALAPSPAEATPLHDQQQDYTSVAVAPVDFAITPLSTMAPRHADFPSAAAGEEPAAAAPRSTPGLYPQQPGMGAQVGGLADLNVTPLSSMRSAGTAAGMAAAGATQPGVLQERTNSRALQQPASLRQQQPSPPGSGLPPVLQSPSSSVDPETLPLALQAPPLIQSLSLGSMPENLPSPEADAGSVGFKKAGQQAQQGQHASPEAQQLGGEAMVIEDSAVLSVGLKLARKGTAATALLRQSSDGEPWHLKVAVGREDALGGDTAMLDASLSSSLAHSHRQQQEEQGSASGPSPGFSFQAAATPAAGQAWQQPGSSVPGAWLSRRGGEGAVALHPQHPAEAGAYVGGGSSEAASNPGLREDILALHLDMLNMHQAQQEQMTALVQAVVERQDMLAAEVRALRKQLTDLLQTRNDFLWL